MRPIVLTLAAVAAAAVPASAAAAWGVPVTLTRDNAELRAPAVARNGAGDAVAAWVRAPVASAPGSGRVAISARRGADGRWSAPRTVSVAGAGAPATARAGRGPAGVAWAAGGRVSVAVRDGRDAGWRTMHIAGSSGAVTDIAVGADAAGAMAVMWAEELAGGHRVRRALRAPGRGWRVSAGSVLAGARPALAVGAAGNGGIAWTVDGRVMLAATGPTAMQRPIGVGQGDSPIPALALGAKGRLLVAWSSRLPGGSGVVVGAERDPRGRVRALGDLGVGDGPRAAINARGRGAIVWSVVDDAGRRSGVQGMTGEAGGVWQPMGVVAQTDCECRHAVADVVVDGRGGLTVAWRRSSQRTADVAALATRADGAARWRSLAMRPVPVASDVDLATGGAEGVDGIWAAAPDVRVVVRR